MSLTPNYEYITDESEARAALAAFAGQPIIGLDTETFWDFGRRENRLSLLQLAAPTGEVIVVDALSAGVEPPRLLIEDPEAWMAAHNARFDEGVLAKAGYRPAGLVDTLRLARRTLALSSFSLASVVEHLFGVTLDKSFQQSNWRSRPLSRAQLDYAALDAVTALRVYQTLVSQLEYEGRLAEELPRAQLDVVRATAAVTPKSRAVRRPPIELRPLTPDERRLVERLRLWRRDLAARSGVPPFLICPDKTLEHLAIARPRSLDQLPQIFGLGPQKIAQFGPDLLAQLPK